MPAKDVRFTIEYVDFKKYQRLQRLKKATVKTHKKIYLFGLQAALKEALDDVPGEGR